ncbi:Zinc-finger domain containing protein [Pandoravirus salinus]|uniref:Zinc-finger domain containing protein n=1 Tax=Pandoravirus salinus TaxID=1349410 RepID=S4W542_9VIRU|nr:Zinc-finger domain [Pandoravirus salinus]AGO85455.1 Zinc-finger domain containing protein [Pandoravirus salinus]
MNRAPTTDTFSQSSRKRHREPAPSPPSSSPDTDGNKDDDDSNDAVRPLSAKRIRSVRANSVLGVHVADTPTGRRCLYCSDTFSRKTSVGNLRNHLVKKHGIGIVDGPGRSSPTPATNRAAGSAPRAVATKPVPSESVGPLRAPKTETLLAVETLIKPPPSRDVVDAIDLPTLLVDLCTRGRTQRLVIAVHGLARQKGESATFVIADVDALAEIDDTLGETLETIARRWGLFGRLVAVCSNVPSTVSARVETALGVPVLPCAISLLATGAASAGLYDAQVRRIVSRVVSAVMWDTTFVGCHYESRTRFARNALEHASRSTDALSVPDRDRTAARLFAGALSPLDAAHDLIMHPLMQSVGPVVAVAVRTAAVHYGGARRRRRRRQDSMSDETDALVVEMRMRIGEALAQSTDRILDTDAGLLAVFLDPRTKDFGFIVDAARRRALLVRATGLLRSTLRSTVALDAVAHRRGDDKGDEPRGADKSSNDRATTNNLFFASAVSSLFGDVVGRPAQGAQDTGADEIHAYGAMRPAPLFFPDATPTDPAAWWRERKLIFPNLWRLARAYACVSAVCVAPTGTAYMGDTSAS